MPRMLMIVEVRPVDKEHEDEFNRWYSTVEIPAVLETPGFISASRYILADPVGADDGDEPGRYLTIWEIDAESPEVAQKTLTDAMGAGKWSLNESIDYANLNIRFYEPISEHITR